jgi:pyruvate dehydrogenase E1 component alpha subunit
VRGYLQERGLVDDAREAELVERLTAEVDAAIEAAEAIPRPGPEAMFESAYARPPARVAAQRAAFAEGGA